MKIVKDVFNSEVFKQEMGNIILNDEVIYTQKEFDNLDEEIVKKGYSHVTIKVPSANKKLVNLAMKNGYVLADTLIEYVFIVEKSKLSNVQHMCAIDNCTEKDLPYLKKIAKSSFAIDRFHSDETLDDELCDAYYEKWIENSFYGFADKVIVAKYNDEPVGFTTGKVYKDDEYGHLVLSAVSNKYRGIGVYTSMIYEGVNWILREHSELKGVIVGTQLDNIAVQKAWIKLGFTVMDSMYVLQKHVRD